jgi:hypothetical protein
MTGPRIELIPEPRDDSKEEAKREVLKRWVDTRLRPHYSWLWPEQTASGREGGKPVPWPRCWLLHPGLVAELQMLMDWELAIRAGKGSYREAADWLVHLHSVIQPDVRDIAIKTCANGHVDASVPPRHEAPDEAPPAPALPWMREFD